MYLSEDNYDIIFCVIIIIVTGVFAIKPKWYLYVSIVKIDYEEIPRIPFLFVRALSGILTLYAIFCIVYYVVFGQNVFL